MSIKKEITAIKLKNKIKNTSRILISLEEAIKIILNAGIYLDSYFDSSYLYENTIETKRLSFKCSEEISLLKNNKINLLDLNEIIIKEIIRLSIIKGENNKNNYYKEKIQDILLEIGITVTN